ncbi:magnesium-transporting ATPase (P-type) [Bacilli bacterium PM5-3]|nr:magnesium-transporting ATPase (P-type) [Bacilli bacterium PM5-3]MDH6603564.1 magnesium-transporting ATPase (P-type) [Bacilli bacterium PM5-9]
MLYIMKSGEKMFNRTLILLSVSLTVIVLAFTGFTLYLAFSNGIFTNPETSEVVFKINNHFIMFIIFIVLSLLGAVFTGISYKKQSMLLLIIGTLCLFASSIPSVFYNFEINSKDPFLFSKLIAPSFVLNVIQIFLANKGVTDYKSGLSNINKRK